MLILITTLILFATALSLGILQFTRPGFRYSWLIAVGGSFLAWISVILWEIQIPVSVALPPWQPANLFSAFPSFSADGLSWPYAFGLTTLSVAILLTASAREDFPSTLSWAGMLILCGLGLLAVTSSNALTLALMWAALDLAELITMLRSVKGPLASERTVIAFSARAAGIVLLLLADVVSNTVGGRADFASMPPQAGLLLLAAAGLRLGVLPLHLPYGSEPVLRRGTGTTLRLVTAASSLALLARIPATDLPSLVTVVLLILSTVAALYGSWMWMRAPDELAGRPFWLIGLGALAVASALGGNPRGATAWGTALILAGGTIFLASVQQVWLNRTLLIGAWALSALPFSLTATGWVTSSGALLLLLPALLVSQALIITGFVRHALRSSTRASLESQPIWAKSVYPAGLGLLLAAQLLLGFWGWDGALQIGAWPAGLAASILTLGLLWATPRFPILNPARAHWVQPTSISRLDQLYQNLWTLYRAAGRFSQTIADTLEGEGGIMWTLLFLILLVSLIVQRKP
jgi:hypothetical protein